MDTFVDAAETFLKAADWLGEEAEPAVTGLLQVAHQLDKQYTAASYAQYTLTHRYLMKLKPQVVETDDDDTDEDLQDF